MTRFFTCATFSQKSDEKSRQKILSRALKLLPHMSCLALPRLACRQRRIWVKNCRSRTLEKNAKCLAKTSRKHANWNVGKWSSCWSAERGPATSPLMISCQLLTQPCNSFRQRLHETQVTPTRTNTHIR